jgi:hypothetical protein
MSTEVSDDDIIQLIDRMGVDHTKGIDFQVFKRILMLFPSRYTRSGSLALLAPALACMPHVHHRRAPVRSSIRIHRNISISNVFDYWFRHIIDTGSEPQRTPFSLCC